MNQKIKIMVVDDHPIVRDGIISFLNNRPQFEVVGTATDGYEAVQKVGEISPDIILMDIGMPIMNGIEATKIISKKYPSVKILILTVHNEKGYVLQIIKSGAKGYVLKDIEAKELENAIMSIYKGDIVIDPEVSKILLSDYISGPENNKRKENDLTKREIEVLKLIAKGMGNKEIAEKLFLSINTIKVHKENIMKKLNIHNVANLTKYANEIGLSGL